MAKFGVFVGGGEDAEAGGAGNRSLGERGEAGAKVEGDEHGEAAAAAGCVTSRALTVDEGLPLCDADVGEFGV